MELQINERDVIIQKLTATEGQLRTKEKVLDQIIDYKVDSVGTISFQVAKGGNHEILRYDDLTELFGENITLVDSIMILNKLISTLETATGSTHSFIYNKADTGRYDMRVNTNSVNIKEYNRLRKENLDLSNLYNRKKTIIDVITRMYPINYTVDTSSNEGTAEIMIGAPKIDSALRLLPYFRDNLIYDKESNAWLIVRERIVREKVVQK